MNVLYHLSPLLLRAGVLLPGGAWREAPWGAG